MRVLAVLLVLAAVGSLAVSYASHDVRREIGRQGITEIDNVDIALDPNSTYEVGWVPNDPDATATYDEYDGMPWDDARLWLGLAIGFAVSAAGVGVVAARTRRVV